MKRNVIIAGAVVVFLLSLCFSVFAEEIKVAAGSTASAAVLQPLKEHFEKATGHKLSILTAGSKAAMTELEKRNVHAACAAHTFDELMASLKSAVPAADAAAFQWVGVAEPTKMIVVVNKRNPAAKLSKEQLRDIFTGKMTNWKDAGGPDMPVIPVNAALVPLTNSAVKKYILDDQPFTKDILSVNTTEDVKLAVSSNAEAIGFISPALTDASVKIVDAPVVTLSPVVVVTKGAPSSSVQQMIDFIKGPGKQHIKQ